jgi:Lrp/AsnC family leucine-responsive transcriptional regulator
VKVVGFKLDEVDISILSHLRNDGKTHLKELARTLRVHPNTLLQRLRKLEKAGIIRKYVAVVDYAKTGLDLHLIITMKLKRACSNDLKQLKELTGITEVEALYATSGLWDVFALCRVKNRNHMLDVIQKINDHPVVVKTSSSIVLYDYKSPADFNPYVYEKKL